MAVDKSTRMMVGCGGKVNGYERLDGCLMASRVLVVNVV